MKIFDISRELLSSKVFPGDPSPRRITLYSMEKGSAYNLSGLSMCAHNGTHVDAPNHFIKDGVGIDGIPLYKTVGPAYVVCVSGVISSEKAKNIYNKALAQNPEAAKRILIKGDAVVSEEAARIFADLGIYLIGNESQTVGPEDAPMAVHKILLSRQVVLLEGIRLDNVNEGVYLLCCAPINIAGADGSPCRAILIEM